MSSEYQVRVTSPRSAIVSDIPLQTSEMEAMSVRRKIARIDLVENIHNKAASVRLCLIHQRRNAVSNPWEDAKPFNLAFMKAGEEVRLTLDSSETLLLLDALLNQYAVAKSLLPAYPQEDEEGHLVIRAMPYEKSLVVLDADDAYIAEGKEKDAIMRLLKQAGTGFWGVLEELQPDLLQSAAAARTHRIRRTALDEFREQLQLQTWSENDWDNFFRQNKWIFGYGLDYKFLSEIQSQPNYGATDVTGHGGQRGDYLMASEAQRRFTVLVEIKKPNSDLVTSKQYRNRVHELGEHLVGGVSQLQSNCRTWAVEGSRSDANRDRLEWQDTFTVEPKGILVVGNTAQLDTRDKCMTFEVFRQNLHNPQVLTYDELFARAEFIVSQEPESLHAGEEKQEHIGATDSPTEQEDFDLDDLPF